MKSKEELKEQYKLIKPKIGVFQIRNTVNGKILIDSSANLDKIWNRHRTALNFGNHHNAALQAEWNTLGENSFTFEILSEVRQTDDQNVDYAREAKRLAEMFIEELQPYAERGYNRKP